MHLTDIEVNAVTAVVAIVTVAWIAKSSLDDLTALAEKCVDCYYRVRLHIRRLRNGDLVIEEVNPHEPHEPHEVREPEGGAK